MNYIHYILIFLFTGPLVLGQQYSKNIPMDMEGRSGDFAKRIIPTEDGYFILTNNLYYDDTTTKYRVGLLKTDRKGNEKWKTIINRNNNENIEMHVNGPKNMVLLNDTIFVAVEAYPPSEEKFIRLMAFDVDGSFLYKKDVHIPHSSSHLYGRGLISNENKIILYGSVNDESSSEIFIKEFDKELNILDSHLIGDPSHNKLYMELNRREDGGYVLAYAYGSISYTTTVITRMDESFQVEFSKEILEAGNSTLVNVYEAKDGGFMLTWQKDIWGNFGKFPFPTTVYKLDSLANVEWEYVFVHQAEKGHINAVETSDGDLFGMGITDYYYIHDTLTDTEQWSNGWCFLMDQEGNLQWERSIADVRDSFYKGRLWHGIETEEGYAMIGDIDHWTETGEPFLNDHDVWFLTLDENGCWNGNCNEYIMITGDTTSVTDNEPVPQYEREITAYPNPTAGEITIDCADCTGIQNRMVRVFDSNGKKVAECTLHAPRSTINLSQLEEGIYFATYIIEGRRVKTQKVVVQR